MSDRTVTAILKANVSSLVNGMKQAQKATEDFAKKSTKSATDNKAQWQQLGHTSMVAGGLLAVGVGLAVKSFADFDKSMSGVKAVANATAGEMDKLRGAALKAGADTKYSATEAAKAEEELAKVGISTADILAGALTGSLNLAAAGNLDLGEAAAISGKAMKIFSLAGKDVGHIADVMAAGANKSAADVTDLGQALAQGGLIAAQTGLTLEDTVGTLAAFADNALMGSDAGTSMKTMLMRLNPQSDEAAGLMDELGLRAYDANGEFVGMAEYAGKLQTGLAGLSDEQRNAAMTTLFGSDAVRGANILYKIGADGVREYTSAVNDEGAAARMAAIQMDNLSGDLEQLKGSIETALIQAGSGGNDALRSMAQFATGAVNAFGELPAPVQKSALGIAAVASAGLLATGAFLTVVPKIQSTKTALAEMGVTSGRSGAALKGLGKAAGAAAAIFAVATAATALGNSMRDAVPGVEATTAALLAGGDAASVSIVSIDGLFKGIKSEIGPGTTHVDGLASAFARLTDKHRVEGFTDSLGSMFGQVNSGTQSAEVFNNIGTALGKLVTSGKADQAKDQFDAMAKKLNLTGDETLQLMKLMPAYGESLAGVANESKLAAGGTDTLTGAQTDMASETTKAKDAINAEVQALQDAGLVVLSTRAATRDFRQAQVDATEAIKKNGQTLDQGTQKGRDNATVLDSMSTKALHLADSIYKETGSEEKMRASLVTSRAALVKTYLQFDNNRGRANAYADSILKIPAHKKTQVELDAAKLAKANADLAALKRKITGLPKGVVKVSTFGYAQTYQYLMTLQAAMRGINNTPVRIATGAGGRGGTTLAGGGLLDGPGTTTSDSIPMWGSKGEYMVKAAAVSKYGVSHFDDLNSMRFAAGGYVGPTATTATTSSLGNTVRLDKATIRALGREIATRPNVLDGQIMAASVDRRVGAALR